MRVQLPSARLRFRMSSARVRDIHLRGFRSGMAQQNSGEIVVLLPRRGRSAAIVAMALAGVLAAALGGCDQSRRVVVRQPVPNPTPAPVSQPAQIEQPRVETADQPSAAPQAPAVSPEERLARQVEAIFASGEKEYKDGHLSAARQQFDRSLDMLLESGLDIQGNARLSALFDKIVSTVHSAELIAFREGDGFSEQKSAPAPIDEIATTVAPD